MCHNSLMSQRPVAPHQCRTRRAVCVVGCVWGGGGGGGGVGGGRLLYLQHCRDYPLPSTMLQGITARLQIHIVVIIWRFVWFERPDKTKMTYMFICGFFVCKSLPVYLSTDSTPILPMLHSFSGLDQSKFINYLYLKRNLQGDINDTPLLLTNKVTIQTYSTFNKPQNRPTPLKKKHISEHEWKCSLLFSNVQNNNQTISTITFEYHFLVFSSQVG